MTPCVRHPEPGGGEAPRCSGPIFPAGKEKSSCQATDRQISKALLFSNICHICRLELFIP
jgi:hypothetical protein